MYEGHSYSAGAGAVGVVAVADHHTVGRGTADLAAERLEGFPAGFEAAERGCVEDAVRPVEAESDGAQFLLDKAVVGEDDHLPSVCAQFRNDGLHPRGGMVVFTQDGHHIGHILLEIPSAGELGLVEAGEEGGIEGLLAFEVLAAQLLADLALTFEHTQPSAPQLREYQPPRESGLVVEGSVEIEDDRFH